MAKLRGFGAYLPARVVDNAEIGPMCGADPAWIKSQTGIEQRRWAAPEERVADLGVKAARDCLANCGALATEIELVMVSSGSAERRFPGPAASIAAALGLAGKPAIDLPIASAGSLVGLALAADLAGHYGNVLVIRTEIMSRVIGLNPAYKDTGILFGDGAEVAWSVRTRGLRRFAIPFCAPTEILQRFCGWISTRRFSWTGGP